MGIPLSKGVGCMRRLLLILLTLLLLITSIPVAYSEQSDWVTSYSDAGITVL